MRIKAGTYTWSIAALAVTAFSAPAACVEASEDPPAPEDAGTVDDATIDSPGYGGARDGSTVIEPLGAAATGNLMRTVVPFPTALSISTSAFWRCAIP